MKDDELFNAYMNELRAHMADEVEKTAPRLDTWKSIESEVRLIAAEYQQRPVRIQGPIWSGWFDSVREWGSLRNAVVGLSALALVIVVNTTWSGTSELQNIGTSRTAEGLLGREGFERQLQQLARSSFTAGSKSPLQVLPGVMSNFRSRVQQKYADRENGLVVQQVINRDLSQRDYLVGGLRSRNTDFEHLQSDRTLKILSGENEDDPPAIWVALDPQPSGTVETLSDLRVDPQSVN